ncbi:di-N-acetylchitobiase-like [Palaemon carinicauda]|uniref:di-N-acetylchitobiase-like n=1 Tax=Palaemon carinicauda TaxID=392227 RepID=UPI0035B5E022
MNWRSLLAVLWILSLQTEASGRLLQSPPSLDNILEGDSNTHLNCPCEDELLCLPLEEARRRDVSASHVEEYLRKSERKEVFAFVLKCDISIWSKFNWTRLTTIAIAGFYDADLVCHAHRNGVKVVKLGFISTSDLPNPESRSTWVKLQASDVVLKYLDGINIDYEDAIADGSAEQEGLTALVRETAETFHRVLPGSQVSFDVAWNAGGVDGRFYDYKEIGNYSDILFIMAYDEQSQIFTQPCSARPNSGIYKTSVGIKSYLDLGIPPEKLILGVPWYGYNYPCESLLQNGTCLIKEVPFRGANCSDAAGKEYPYSYMIAMKKKYHATYHWDKNSLTPYYTFKDDAGQYRQMRYDDARSLVYKYVLAVATGLRGVGMWAANFLDYSDSSTALEQQSQMWGLLP